MVNYGYYQQYQKSTHIFAECEQLEEVRLPNSLTEIPLCMFQECSNLKKITIPNTVKVIRQSTFGSCKSLTEIIIPNGVETIEENAFKGCPIKEIVVPDSVTSIGRAFNDCMLLEKIKLSDSIKELRSVGYCPSLKSINLPASLEKVSGGYLFTGLGSLTETIVPDSLKKVHFSINESEFEGCSPSLLNQKKLRDLGYRGKF